MDPDTLTVSQIRQALRVKHAVSIIGVLAAVASAGYWWGSSTSANSSAKEVVAVQADNSRLASDLRERDKQLEESRSESRELRLHRDELRSRVLEQDRHILALAKQAGVNRTCLFVREQIESLQAQVASVRRGPSIRMITQGAQGAVLTNDEKEEIADIERRMSAFQQQLASCAAMSNDSFKPTPLRGAA